MTENLHVVVGAGPIGSAVAELLAAQGEPVRVVSRSGRGPEASGIERVAADAADPSLLTELCGGAVALYNCANPPYHRWASDWPPLAASLLGAAEATGAVLAVCNNLYAYGPVDGPMSEDLPLAATDTKGRVRAQMWQDAVSAHQAGRLRVTEVRASDYVGPNAQSHLGDRVVPRVVAGKSVRVLGSADQPHTWTYTRDVARLLVTVAADERAWGRAWHVPSNAPRTQRQAIADIAQVAGVPGVAVKTLPTWVLKATGVAVPVMREIAEMIYQFERPFVLDSSAAERTFGLAPTPWADVLADHVEAFRAAPRRAA